MFNLVSSILVVVLLILILVLGYLVYLHAAYKAEIENLLHKEKIRKLYTFVSATEQIEDIVFWREYNQHLRLTMDNGSLYFISTPAEYRLIIQDQPEEEI